MKNLEDMMFIKITKENPIDINIKYSENKYLYNYTRVDSLPGIVGENIFWVTQSDFLNDQSEVKYISQIIKCVIRYLLENKKEYNYEYFGYKLYDIFINILISIEEVYKDDMLVDNSNAFILSFTENKNNLNLFINYSGKDGGAIEFKNNIDEMFLSEILKKYNMIMLHGKVVYDIKDQIEILLNDINDLYMDIAEGILEKEIVNIDDKIYENIVEEIKNILCIKILNYAFFFKSHHFKGEEEYRVIFLLNKKYTNKLVKYRIREGVIIPYIEIKYKKDNVNEIYISPQNQNDLLKRSIEFFLNGKGYKNVGVINSDIPFR